jgi:hypothetical protein
MFKRQARWLVPCSGWAGNLACFVERPRHALQPLHRRLEVLARGRHVGVVNGPADGTFYESRATRRPPTSGVVLQSVIQGTKPEPAEARAARLERLAAFGEPWVFGIPAGGTSAFVERHGLQLVSDRKVAAPVSHYVGREIPGEFRARAETIWLALARVPR